MLRRNKKEKRKEREVFSLLYTVLFWAPPGFVSAAKAMRQCANAPRPSSPAEPAALSISPLTGGAGKPGYTREECPGTQYRVHYRVPGTRVVPVPHTYIKYAKVPGNARGEVRCEVWIKKKQSILAITEEACVTVLPDSRECVTT